MDLITFIGLAAAVVSTITQLPQAWKTIRSKDTYSLSLSMYILFWIATSLWLTYGILKKDPPLIFSNSIAILPITFILGMKIHNVRTGRETQINHLLNQQSAGQDAPNEKKQQ